MTDETPILSPDELADIWPLLLHDDRIESFRMLSRVDSEEFFFNLESRDQAFLIHSMPSGERRSWIRILAPDDAADVVQESSLEEREELLALLDETTRREVNALLAYEEDEAGGLMNPRYIRLRPEISVDEAITYFRRQAYQRADASHYAYVLDQEQRLLGVVSVRELICLEGRKKIVDVMETELLTVREETDQEEVGHLIAEYNLMAVPVIDAEGRMKGVVTVDDIVDVFKEEATEDIQKIGGMEALDEPYLEIGFRSMIRKRAGWLSILFVSEMLTTTAMGFFEKEIERAAVLALFLPLIISSGGNSGSQAATLVVRAMALGELRLRDWWRVMRREIAAGLVLGTLLGVIGFCRILIWHFIWGSYGTHSFVMAVTIFFSLIGVVLWGTFSGSMLPIILRRAGLDPASASAPFVATLVDVVGLVIYFTMASVLYLRFI